MDEFIMRCLSLQSVSNDYYAGTVPGIGEVVLRQDGYFGLVISTIDTPNDKNEYTNTHITFMTYAPMIFFMLKYNISDLTDAQILTLLDKIVSNSYIFSEWLSNNRPYLNHLTLIWCSGHIPHTRQKLCTTITPISYRKSYEYFVNPYVQCTDPHSC